MSGSVGERLIAMVSRPVPEAVRRNAALHLLDWIACAAIGATEPPSRVFRRHAAGLGPGPSSAIRAERRTAMDAAFVNGALGNILEMDDLHRESIVHPGDVVVPAVLAVAERDGCDGVDLLDAIVRGYDTAIRIGIAAGADHYRYWYNSATCGVFGAAAGAAAVMALDRAAALDALGLAGMQAAGLWQCRLEEGEAKQLATAHAARVGLLSADLARLGMAGPHRILEGELGFFRATSPQADAETVLRESDWLILDTSFKPWPACRHSHPVIELGLELRQRTGAQQPDPEEVDRIEIRTYGPAIEFCDDPVPDTPHRGRFSLQHAFAASFLYGVPTMDFAESGMLHDRAVAALRKRVVIEEDERMSAAFPARYPAAVRLVLTSGETIDAEVATARGDPENPVGKAELRAKHAMLLEKGGLDDQEIAALETAVAALADPGDISGLSAALAPLTEPDSEEGTEG